MVVCHTCGDDHYLNGKKKARGRPRIRVRTRERERARAKGKARRQLPPGRVKESLAPWLYVMNQLIRMKAGRIRMKATRERRFQDGG